MFEDRDVRDVHQFPSNWKQERITSENSCQTEELTLKEAESQVVYSDDKSIQTEERERDSADRRENGESGDEPTRPSLLKFLASAAPLLEQELDLALRSRAFDGYELIEDEADKSVRTLYNLHSNGMSDDDFRVSDVTWSCSGSVLAVAYERETHDDWCDHETYLAIWNINRRDFDPSAPFRTLSVHSCLTRAKFHPLHPGFIGGGGYNGEVYVWSITKEGDPLVASSSVSGHREPVTGLSWVTSVSTVDSTLRGTELLTAALDGKMILWKVDTNDQELGITRAFVIVAEHLPKQLKAKARNEAEVGITCISVNHEDKDIVLIGTEAGPIFQGSLQSELPLAAHDDLSHNPPKDPVTVVFQGHKGRVVDIRCSPYKRDVFLSAGSDQEVRIYSLLQPHAPVYVVHIDHSSISRINWSPAKPLAFAVTVQDNTLQLQDLMRSKKLELRPTEKIVRLPLTTVAFNKRDRTLLATGDGKGHAQVWRLTEDFSSGNPSSELEKLEQLFLLNED